jgi:uncharacterized protein DUF4430
VAAALLWAAAAAGCGLGPGGSSAGEATLTVTRDYGATALTSATEQDPAASETVLRFLDRNAKIETRYGGRFVQSIDGLAGTRSGDDWFFYVNGIESSVGAADVRLHGGDRIWWDYRDWTAAMRVPAVVGSWPEPFRSAQTLVAVECSGERSPCDRVVVSLHRAGARAQIEPPGFESAVATPRVLVGPWASLRKDRTARTIEAGPQRSGVFAKFTKGRAVALDQHGKVARTLPGGAGLVAALREGDAPPTWVVTGTRAAGVVAAAGLLNEATLRDRYAVASAAGGVIGLPAR